MRCVVVGFGVQGAKRRAVAGPDCVGIVDPVHAQADWRRLEDVPADGYDAVLLCTPDDPKPALIAHAVGLGKHVLVEKPLLADDDDGLLQLETLARARGVVIQTAYNHRFEPGIARLQALIASGELGRLYRCRLFYGNGTARLVRESAWRDQGAGVIPDLCSHLLDMARFWFGDVAGDFRLAACNRFENASPDHAVVMNTGSAPELEFEMSLLSWRNHFTCDLYAEHGSAHLSSLCKWGPASFSVRRRKLPSGRPDEDSVEWVQSDPTWALEYDAFRRRCAAGLPTDLSTDRWIRRTLADLAHQVPPR